MFCKLQSLSDSVAQVAFVQIWSILLINNIPAQFNFKYLPKKYFNFWAEVKN